MAKKTGIVLLVLFLLLILVIAALPLWMPWAVSPVLSRLDVEYETYERVGYGRFALSDVTYQRKGLRVEAARVEGFGPTGWLWNRWHGTEEVDYLTVKDWRVEIDKFEEPIAQPEEEETKEDVSVFEIFGIVEEVLDYVVRWVPRATLGKGELLVVEREIEVRGAEWREGHLTAEVFDRSLGQVVDFEGDVRGGLPFLVEGRTHPFPFKIEVKLSRSGEQVVVGSQAYLAGNLLEADAEFPRDGYLPTRARFRSDAFELPRDYLDLEGYDDIFGSLMLEWHEGRFVADLSGRANPVASWEGRLPPLHVEAAARGDLESFLVEKLEVRSPWLVATLSDPVAMDYGGELLSEESLFQVAADLSEQPFVELRGMMRGDIRISPGNERLPLVNFQIQGTDFAGFDLELARVGVTGHLRWPELKVERFVIEAEDETSVTGTAVMDMETRVIAGGKIDGSVGPGLVRPWLPEELMLSRLIVKGEFEGPVLELEHRGTVEVEGFVAPSVHPTNGRLEWTGRMENLSAFDLELSAGAGRMAARGATRFEEERFELLLEEFVLERGEETLLSSLVASRFLVDWGGDIVTVSLDELQWVGEDRSVEAVAEVAWPQQGHFGVELRGLHTGLATDFVDVEETPISLSMADIKGNWEEGPINFRALGEIRMGLAQGDVFINIDASGDEGELRIQEMRGASHDQILFSAEGILPVAIWPGRERVIDLHETGQIDLRASTNPRADFWEEIGKLTGVHLEDPRLSLEIGGRAYAPEGTLVGSSPLINLRAFDDQDGPVLSLENLIIATSFDVEEIRVDEFSLEVEGQRVELQATLPMGTREWQTLMEERKIPDWKRVTGSVAIPEARLAAFTRFAPTILSPQGILQAAIEIREGGLLDGVITLEEAATRPLMPVGTIREGTARIELRGRKAHLEEISAVIGGERLTVSGVIDIPFEQPLAFDIGIRGRNLPLTRQPGVVIRGDLNLFVRSQDGAIPVISGRVDLRDSFYLAHLRLMPGGSVATPDRRPPFFSVSQEPFANWRLNVDLRGPDFLNIRGPIFQGEVSANFNLSGTLEEPRAIGAATIDSGRVRFPFASMRIDQGEIALRREDPFQPQLFIIASGMTFGYDLTMEITGTAETPIIEFFSSPPLTSEQALLMVTTGELPREEIRFTTQQRASRFAIYFGQNLLYEITGDAAAGEGLTIRTGEQVSESGRETIAIELKLTERWSITGEYDRFDEYNAGLKWNIFSR